MMTPISHARGAWNRRRVTLAAVAAAATTAVLASLSTASATSAPSATWTGEFTGYNSAAWQKSWGVAPKGAWGQADLKKVADSTAPGDGSALQVTYGKGSSSNSCTNCSTKGGGQFYTDLTKLGRSDLAKSATLDLKYSLKFPIGFDFGQGGKLPGLYGGVIGQESGGTHGNGWSTRYMFRAKCYPNDGELYLYTPTNSGPTGYGVDLGVGNWQWTADNHWHTAEQFVNRATGDITVWFDGKQVLAAKHAASGISKIPFGGVFFSTFFGGHDTSWGPKKTESAQFANFSLSSALQH
ncbi:polysaccharide lyase [Streptomyces mauvecolor]